MFAVLRLSLLCSREIYSAIVIIYYCSVLQVHAFQQRRHTDMTSSCRGEGYCQYLMFYDVCLEGDGLVSSCRRRHKDS